jgi:hypothetical protein
LLPYIEDVATVLMISPDRIEFIEVREGSTIMNFQIKAFDKDLEENEKPFDRLMKLGKTLQSSLVNDELQLYGTNMLEYRINIIGSLQRFELKKY